tara:strand:- start:14411 stop:17566 length:3156 start_codon:yes stop_codon:yes gene_type:complete
MSDLTEKTSLQDLFKGKTRDELKEVSHTKLDSRQWSHIELTFNGIQQKIATMMKLYGQKEYTPTYTDVNFKTCGDEVYSLIIRPILEKVFKGLPKVEIEQTNVKVKGVKKGKSKKIRGATGISADEIRKKQIHQKVSKSIELALENVTDIAKFNPNSGFISEFIEIRILTLIFCIHNTFRNKSMREADIYELIVGVRKVINGALKYNESNPDQISQQAIMDLDFLQTKLSRFKSYSSMVTCEKYPRLIISTDYDRIMPFTSLKPYPSQSELIDTVYDRVNSETIKPTLVLLRAMIGSGKTTTSVSIASLVESIKRSGVDIELLFCCSVEPVRHQVGAFHYNTEIPFGIGTMDGANPIVTNHYSCTKITGGRIRTRHKALRESSRRSQNACRVSTIADLTTTLGLLNQSKRTGKKYILFIDEPTVGADQEDSPITSLVAEILNVAPEFTILASATMPKKSELKGIVDHFEAIYPDCLVKEIVSMETMIGNQIIDLDGNIIAPHTGCKNRHVLKHVINRIEFEPFVSRLYTAPIIGMLHQNMVTNGIKNIPDLDERFGDVKNLNQQNIQKTALELLNILSKYPNQTIENVCTSVNKKGGFTFRSKNIIDEALLHEPTEHKEDSSEDDVSDEEDMGFEWDHVETDPKIEIKQDTSKYFENSKLFTTDSYKFVGSCLYAVTDPIKFSEKLSEDFLKDIDIEAIMNKYKTELAIHKKKIEELKKRKISEPKKGKVKSKRGDEDKEDFGHETIEKGFTKEQRDEQIAILESSHPKIVFPEYLQINTLEHLKHFKPEALKDIDRTIIRGSLSFEEIPEFVEWDWIVMLLWCGVGIYSPQSNLSKDYTDYILHLASSGKLAFLIADDSISYGANYPFSHVIVEDEMASRHSIGSIMQLLGRAGRVGRSWTAHGYLGKETSSRLLEFIQGTETSGATTEARNLIKALQKSKQRIIDFKIRIEEEKKSQEEFVINMEKEKIRREIYEKALKKAKQEKAYQDELEKNKAEWGRSKRTYSNTNKESSWQRPKKSHTFKSHTKSSFVPTIDRKETSDKTLSWRK